MKKIILLLLICISISASAQQVESDYKTMVRETNARKSANFKDVLTPLFRAGINNLLGDKHSFSFNSSFYGIDSIFSNQPRNAKTEKYLRQNSFNIGLTGDTLNRITKFSGGFTLTILNKRDIKYTDFEDKYALRLQLTKRIESLLRRAAMDYYPDEDSKSIVRTSLNDAFDAHDFKNVDPLVTKVLKDPATVNAILVLAGPKAGITGEMVKEMIDELLNGKDVASDYFKEVLSIYERKPLWVFRPTFSYDRINKQGEYAFETIFTVGIGKLNEKPWELEVNSKFLISADSTIKSANYKNKPLSLSLGVNKVLIRNENKESQMEFKFFSQYYYKVGAYVGRRDEFTLNSTLRVNVFKSLWIPITVKYDPKNGNVFGFFSITANIGN